MSRRFNFMTILSPYMQIVKLINKFMFWLGKQKPKQNLNLCINSKYHLVPANGYPLILSITLFLFIFNLMNYTDLATTRLLSFCNSLLFSIMLILFVVTLVMWLVKVLFEATQGDHTKFVANGLKIGFLLFVSSEIMLFFAVFWGWFHINLLNEFIYTEDHSSNYLDKINWFPLPAIGTLILGASSALLTESHYTFNWLYFSFSKIKNLFNFFQLKYINSSYRLIRMTCGFGFLFLILQSVEYNMLGYSWRGHVYASLFYMITSLHGSHVLIGLIFLIICYFRVAAYVTNLNLMRKQLIYKFTSNFIKFFILKIDYIIYFYLTDLHKRMLKIQLREQRHIFFEVSAWYWHFVDIVWLFVFLYVYFWLTGYQFITNNSLNIENIF